jgi:hypothetical protein
MPAMVYSQILIFKKLTRNKVRLQKVCVTIDPERKYSFCIFFIVYVILSSTFTENFFIHDIFTTDNHQKIQPCVKEINFVPISFFKSISTIVPELLILIVS